MHVAPDPKDGQRCPFLPVTTPTLVDAYTTLVGRQAMSSRESFSRNNRQDSLTRLVIQGHSSSVRTDCARIGGSYSPFPRGSPGSRWKCDASNPAGPCIYIYIAAFAFHLPDTSFERLVVVHMPTEEARHLSACARSVIPRSLW